MMTWHEHKAFKFDIDDLRDGYQQELDMPSQIDEGWGMTKYKVNDN